MPGATLGELRAEIVRIDGENRARAAKLGLSHPPSMAAVLHHHVAVECQKRGEIEAAAQHLAEVNRLAPEYYAKITRSAAPPPAR